MKKEMKNNTLEKNNVIPANLQDYIKQFDLDVTEKSGGYSHKKPGTIIINHASHKSIGNVKK